MRDILLALLVAPLGIAPALVQPQPGGEVYVNEKRWSWGCVYAYVCMCERV